jgi:hypothetical protein
MRKLTMLFIVSMTFAVAFNATVAFAEPPSPCFDDDFVFFLNPQPLPPG